MTGVILGKPCRGSISDAHPKPEPGGGLKKAPDPEQGHCGAQGREDHWWEHFELDDST